MTTTSKQATLFDAPTTMHLTLLGVRDERGRCDFQLEWTGYRPDLGGQGPRAQHFFAKPEGYVADLERRGYHVEFLSGAMWEEHA